MNQALPIAATALVLLAGCMQDGTRSGAPLEATHPGAPLQVTRITPEAPSIVYHSGFLEPLREAVFDEAKFTELWSQAFAARSQVPALPKVDFEREFVVVAALGERSSGGFTIEVAHAAGEGGEVVVEIASTAPGKGCMVTLAMTQPVDFVKIPRPARKDDPVRFVEKPSVKDCGS